MPTYSQETQIHCMSALSNAAFGKAFGSLTDAQSYVSAVVSAMLSDTNTAVTGLIGSDWETVWGPVVMSEDPANSSVVVDNTMMLTYSPSQNLYVLAIAGTNLDSTYDWLKEDFQVKTTQPWRDVIGRDPDIFYYDAAISQGTYQGLQNLLTLKDSNHDNQTMISTLQAFLATQSNAATLAVAGHSLGGALAPTMALYLLDILKTNNWNSNNIITTIAAWPTAGPTPGESTWANYYAHMINTASKPSLQYTSKYNTLDVIPHAWQTSSVMEIPSIYEPAQSGDPGIAVVSGAVPSETITGSVALGLLLNKVDTSKTIPSMINYEQVQPWTPITGSFDTTTDDAVTSKLKYVNLLLSLNGASAMETYTPYFTNFARFLAQMVFQHTAAYPGLLGYTDFSTELIKTEKSTPYTGPSTDALHQIAFSRALGVNLDAVQALAEHAAAKSSSS